MRRSFRTRSCFAGWVPRVGTLGWYAMPIQGMGFETGLGHGIGNGSTLRENGIEPDKRRSERRSAPRPGSATHGYKRSEYDTTTQGSLLPDEGLPLVYGPNLGRCLGFSHGALLGLGRRGSSHGHSSLDSRPRHTAGAFSKFTRGVSDESFIKFA